MQAFIDQRIFRDECPVHDHLDTGRFGFGHGCIVTYAQLAPDRGRRGSSASTSSTMPGRYSERRKTSTMSMGTGTSASVP